MQESEIASSTEHTQPSQANPNDIRKPQPEASTEYWVQDTSLSTIAELITLQLEQDKKEPSQGSVLEDQLPWPNPEEEQIPQQHLCINQIRHQGAYSSLKTLELFRSFTLALRTADPLLVILPVAATKQHYESISSAKQIQTVDENKMKQYFQSYNKKQNYSLSGYFYVISSLPFSALLNDPKSDEGLSVNQYYLKLYPSQTEEMVQVGALCLKKSYHSPSILEHRRFTRSTHIWYLHERLHRWIQKDKNAICVIREVKARQDNNFFQDVVCW